MVVFTVLGYVAIAIVALTIYTVFMVANPEFISLLTLIVTFFLLVEKVSFTFVQALGAIFLLSIALVSLILFIRAKTFRG